MYLLLTFIIFMIGALVYLLSRAPNSERRAELGRLSFIIGLVFFLWTLAGAPLVIPHFR